MEIIKRIETTSKLLDKTSKNKRSTLTDLRLLQDQIANRKKVIENIRSSLQLMVDQLEKENNKQDALVLKYLDHKKDHSELIRMSYIKMLTENKLVYLLSSTDWEESLSRLRYSGMIENFLRRQIDTLDLTSSQVESNIVQMEESRIQYEELLEEEERSFKKLEEDEKRKDRMLAQMEGDEKRLRGALIKQRKDREQMNQAIEKIILASLNKNESTNDGQNAGFGLSGAFKDQKDKLPWPVNNARIISKYGKQKHPTLENVFISNNGIDVFCSKNAPVRAIFKGEVAGALQIPGNDYMIMVKHGNYYTVYSKIVEVYVSKGDRIAAGHTLGKLGVNNAILHFEIWEDKQKLDPEKWLK